MNQHLEQFVDHLEAAVFDARLAIGRRWGGIDMTSMSVALQASVEPGDSEDTLALRLSPKPAVRRRVHELSIEIPDESGDIRVLFDGQLLARYGRTADASE
ncbi:hypothetical protein HU719_021005 [Pseudomonas sp. SWRI107]|uniref:hypothetical protein n=1 Tax=Pseudomonas TaxID=286 RepID=UPI001647B50A|nr:MULTISPECIES: hypothetical protein [Pseudomonas]MBC3413299.1 hypothetical protein [Pseudomonas sp. SWRI51]MBV4533872.1 hypothetical protein [Pseudomonas farsensis]